MVHEPRTSPTKGVDQFARVSTRAYGTHDNRMPSRRSRGHRKGEQPDRTDQRHEYQTFTSQRQNENSGIGFLAFGCWRLAIGDWRLAIGRLAIGVWRLAFWRLAFWRLAFGDWRLAFGDWRLAIGDCCDWRLADWRLAMGDWRLAIAIGAPLS